jgi:methyltransferase (TIGR00027 family)
VARTDDDSWDINESVGATALGVAAGRAAETDSDNPLIVDPYAKLFLEAAGEGIWTVYMNGKLLGKLAEADPQMPARMQAALDYTACRTLFFDEFFLAAAADGIRQAVILAAGLDARAWRLAWPAGSIVYEIDQPRVLAFKTSTLEAHGVQPIATHTSVPVDLRQDWPKALQEAGFDPAAPTAWSAEGLLPYLPPEAQDLLFERIQALSAAGSRVAVEAFSLDFFSPDTLARAQAQVEQYRAAAAGLGQTDIPDLNDLWYAQERTEVVDWLRAQDWDVTATTADELMARNHRTAPADVDDAVPPSVFVDARLA